MEKQEMKITPQDIIDKEFRVKFRGFDMAEVDSFLEEVAENLFKLNEENTVLNEKILALQQDLEEAGSMTGQMELPRELENILEDLKQDMAALNADLVSLKQDRPAFGALENTIKAAVGAMKEASEALKSQAQPDIPADIFTSLEIFQQNSESIAAELAALKEDRQVFDSLKKSVEEIISSARDAGSSITPRQQNQVEIGAELNKIIENFKQATEAFHAEFTALKQNAVDFAGIREDIKKEIQELLSVHFKELDTKLSRLRDRGAVAPPKQKERLLTAEIIEEPEGRADDTSYEDYREEDEDDTEEGALEFLSEDDILDVDKLRNVFQSVLDDEASDSNDNREDDDAAADLLFLDDDLLEDVPEPKVTFSMDDKETGK